MKITYTNEDNYEFDIKTSYATYTNCYFSIERYRNNDNTAIVIKSKNDGQIMTATVNIDKLPFNCVAIKDYSENSGIAEALVEAKVIEAEPYEYVPSGFVVIPIYKLTDRFATYVRATLDCDI